MRPVPRLLAAYACGSLATGLPWPLLLVLVWGQYGDGPHGAWALGLAGAARMAPYVLLSWAVGSLGDHVRRDRLVRVTLWLRLVFLVGATLATVGGHVLLAVGAVALAVTCGTPTYPAIAAALPRLAGPGRAKATEALVTIEVSSWVVGPALGGLLLVQPLRPWTLAASVGLAVLSLVLSTGIALPGPVVKAPDAVGGMLRTVLNCPPALAALGLVGLLNLVVTSTAMVLLPLSEQSWGRGETGYGLATACLGFGALGAPVLARLAARVGGATWPRSLLAVAAAVALVAATPVPWPALPLLALAGAAGVQIESLMTGTLQEVVPDRYRAGALGVGDTVMVGGCLLGSLTAPSLAALTGARPALLVVALAALVPLLLGRGAPALRPVRAPADAPLLDHRHRPAPRLTADERAAAGPDPRGTPAVGAARVG